MNRIDLQSYLVNGNVQAFLKAIRLGEGTSDEAGYYRIVGGGTFTDDSCHPNVRVFLPHFNVYSTAAGAYQIIRPTWNSLQGQYHLPDFSPESQDEAAVALIIDKKAIDDVLQGRIEDAIQKCSAIWASLPGSQAGQRVEALDEILKVYTDNGGTVTLT